MVKRNIDLKESITYPIPKKIYNIENSEASWSNDAENYIYWGNEGDKFAPNYSKAYKIKISPKDFLNLTTEKGFDSLKVGGRLDGIELKKLDLDHLNKERYQPIFLIAEFKDNKNAKIIGHEGRHRMFALYLEGIKWVDVELRIESNNKFYNKYKPQELNEITLQGQFNPDIKVTINNPIAMSWNNHKKIKGWTEEEPDKDYLKEELLLELNRNQLINKSKKSDNYKDQSKGRNRWERRNHSRIDRRVEQYNKIDMNTFFKKDQLKVGINVHGETNDYVVTIRFDNALKAIADEIKRNNNKLEFKCILIALQRTFNNGDVFVSCTCKDFLYRIAFNATKGGYNSGTPELRASNITNPHDTKGAGCKHINLVIGNIDWIMKIASVINNYIHYMEEHYQRLYADVIFPRLFNMPYTRAVQLNLFDTRTD